MEEKLLNRFIEEVRRVWGPLSTDTVTHCQSALEKLVNASISDLQSADLLLNPTAEKELYLDLEHGFVLLAHTEQKGQYRMPHDHGAGWVIYAVLRGEVEMRTYRQVTNQKGKSQLVRRETYRMVTGDCKVYLPGDIHDTRCVSDSVVMLRFSSCDLKKESREGRMIRYADEATE